MAGIERIFQDGQHWYPVGSAARRLRTTATKIRELMGIGTLDWCQKHRSVVLLVSAKSVEAYLQLPENLLRAQERGLNRSTR